MSVLSIARPSSGVGESDSLPLRAAMALDLATVEAMAAAHTGNPIGDAAGAWLATYRNGLSLGFGEVVARQQAAAAWDLANAGEPEPVPCPTAYRGGTVTPAGRAWLRAYRVAHSLGFAEMVAQVQAFAAADREGCHAEG